MMNKAILAVDVGFRATGMALFKQGELILTGCSRPKKDTKRKALRVADSDADRISRMVKEILMILRANEIGGMVVELPSAGAQGARANRGMGIATGMIVTIVECLEIPVEWYTPDDIKKAACGKSNASKEEMMAAMQEAFPALKKITVKADLEHIADACGCYLAAKSGNLVRLLA